MGRVYVSLPLSGPQGAAGRDVLRGAELAGDGGPELVVLDAFGEDREAIAEANARRAVADDEALAYLGDFHSSQVQVTAPILGAAGRAVLDRCRRAHDEHRLRQARRRRRRARLGQRAVMQRRVDRVAQHVGLGLGERARRVAQDHANEKVLLAGRDAQPLARSRR